jgi:hypothetical protein
VIGYIVFGVAAAAAAGLLTYWVLARRTRLGSNSGRRW